MSFTHCWFSSCSWCMIPSLFQDHFRWKCSCLLWVSLKKKGLSHPSIMTLICSQQYKALWSDEEWGCSSSLIKRTHSIMWLKLFLLCNSESLRETLLLGTGDSFIEFWWALDAVQYFGKGGTLISWNLSGFVYFNECNVIPPSKVLIFWSLDSQRCWQLPTPMF